MPQHQTPEPATKTYEIKVILEESTHDKLRKVIWEEALGIYPTEEEARKIVELVELPDMDHIISI